MRRSDMVQQVRSMLSREDFAGRAFSVGLLVALIYLFERLLPLIALFDQGWAVWWPTNGVTLALLLISRRRHWPFVLLGVSLATTLGQSLGANSLSEAGVIALANLVEVLIPALMLPRFYTLTGWLQKPRLVWSFVLSAVVLGPAHSSLLMGSFYTLESHRAFWPTVTRWGVSDAVGMIMFAPLVLVLISPQLYALFQWRKLAETVGALLLLVTTSWVVFVHGPYPITFAIGPVLLLVATRCGFSGSVLAINLLAPIATWASLHGLGPFALMTGPQDPYRIVTVQLFLIVAMLMAFPISVARVQQESTSAQLQAAYFQMEALATADGLTGLANRRRFDAALETEWRRCARDRHPLAVLMLDADNFKKYNDRYGHPAGDLCLQRIATAICDIPQRGGDLVARYGGEEFVILLPGIDAEGAYNLGEQIRYNVLLLNSPHQDNPTGRVTISVGCASMLPTEEVEAASLLEASDRALYLAKKGGRNQSFLYRWEKSKTPDKKLEAAKIPEAVLES